MPGRVSGGQHSNIVGELEGEGERKGRKRETVKERQGDKVRATETERDRGGGIRKRPAMFLRAYLLVGRRRE